MLSPSGVLAQADRILKWPFTTRVLKSSTRRRLGNEDVRPSGQVTRGVAEWNVNQEVHGSTLRTFV